jgi:hypothetical protein
MEIASFRGHFDGHHIQIDDDVALAPNTKLLITVIAPDQPDSDRQEWDVVAASELARAYADNEPEYTEDDLFE